MFERQNRIAMGQQPSSIDEPRVANLLANALAEYPLYAHWLSVPVANDKNDRTLKPSTENVDMLRKMMACHLSQTRHHVQMVYGGVDFSDNAIGGEMHGTNYAVAQR